MSEKSIHKKLLLKPLESLLPILPPQGYPDTPGPLPADILLEEPPKRGDFAQVFESSFAELMNRLPALESYVKPGEINWISYPRETSGIKTDLNRDIIQPEAELHGWTPVSMFSIDSTRSNFRVKRT